MPTHIELLQNMAQVRGCLGQRFTWFIHTTPIANFDGIWDGGLQPRYDMAAPPEVVELLGNEAANILCLHPLGAEHQPAGTKIPPYISLAVATENLPQRVGLDWSYSWDIVLRRMQLYADMPIPEFVSRIASEFGSVACYDLIPANRLRVYCREDRPTHPATWQPLTMENRERVVQHR